LIPLMSMTTRPSGNRSQSAALVLLQAARIAIDVTRTKHAIRPNQTEDPLLRTIVVADMCRWGTAHKKLDAAIISPRKNTAGTKQHGDISKHRTTGKDQALRVSSPWPIRRWQCMELSVRDRRRQSLVRRRRRMGQYVTELRTGIPRRTPPRALRQLIAAGLHRSSGPISRGHRKLSRCRS
jgi:hypothetical protein